MDPQQITPTVPPQPLPVEQPRSDKNMKIMILVFLLLLLGAIITYAIQNFPQPPQSNLLPLSEDVVSPTPEETSEWKTYRNEERGFEFQYSQDLTLEEREKNYIVLLTDPTNALSIIVSIDARLEGAYFNYEKALEKAKTELMDVKEEEINNGVKISGIIRPGLGEGIVVTQAFLKYKNGAIVVETSALDVGQSPVFDQILSSFRFVEEEDKSVVNPIEGSIHVYRIEADSDSTIVSLKATSSAGSINQMRIWTNAVESNEWIPFSGMHVVPFEGRDIIYVQFKDDLGNISDIYSTTTYPQQGPPPGQ